MAIATPLSSERETLLFSFFQTHVDLRRALDAAMREAHGISMGTFEVLSRLQAAQRGGLTLTQLTELAPFSLSRISRLVVDLESRGLVERRACTSDRRVAYVALTEKGEQLVRAGRDTFFTVVEERFLGRLSPEETEVLSTVFARLGGGGAECAGALGA